MSKYLSVLSRKQSVCMHVQACVLSCCSDWILSVGRADGEEGQREGLGALWRLSVKCLGVHEWLLSLSLGRQTAGQTGLGKQWAVGALT